MQQLNVRIEMDADPRELLQVLKQLRVAGLRSATLQVLSKVPRSIRYEYRWLNSIRGRDADRARADLEKLVYIGRVDQETKAELSKLIDEFASLRGWIGDDGMN